MEAESWMPPKHCMYQQSVDRLSYYGHGGLAAQMCEIFLVITNILGWGARAQPFVLKALVRDECQEGRKGPKTPKVTFKVICYDFWDFLQDSIYSFVSRVSTFACCRQRRKCVSYVASYVLFNRRLKPNSTYLYFMILSFSTHDVKCMSSEF